MHGRIQMESKWPLMIFSKKKKDTLKSFIFSQTIYDDENCKILHFVQNEAELRSKDVDGYDALEGCIEQLET